MGNFRLPAGYTLTLGQASLPVIKSWFLVKIEPYTALIKDKRQNVPICNKIVRLFLGILLLPMVSRHLFKTLRDF